MLSGRSDASSLDFYRSPGLVCLAPNNHPPSMHLFVHFTHGIYFARLSAKVLP